jgi:AraC family transcriptional regulator
MSQPTALTTSSASLVGTARRDDLAILPGSRLPPVVGASARDHRQALRLDTSDGESTPIGGSDRPQLSTDAPWQDILTVEQRRVSPLEEFESHPRKHLIGMCLGALCQVEWRIDGGRRHSATMPSRGLWLLRMGTPIRWRQRQEADVLLVALDPTSITNVAGRLARHDRADLVNLITFRDPVIEHIMLAVHAELLDGCPAGRLYGEALATALVARLLLLYAPAPPGAGTHRGGLPPARLRRVVDYIEAHLGGDTSLCKLAGLVQMSPRHFACLFKQSTGLPPHHFVLEQRIAASRQMLVQGCRPLAEIAYTLGFSSQAHFATMFRRSVGVTPGNYRKLREVNPET